MGIPIVTGDIGGPYVHSSGASAPAVMLLGSAKVFIGGKSIMLVGAALTSLGPIIIGSLFTTKAFIEGKPAHLSGSITSTAAGWNAGVLFGLTVNVQIN